MISTDLIKKLKQTSSHLSNNGRNTEAGEIEEIIKQLQDPDISEAGLEELKKKIISRCDIRWLGDIHIKELANPYEWWNTLGSIKSLAERL